MSRNVEISHIHIDEHLCEMHHRAVIRMKELARPGDVISVMVDDYHPVSGFLQLDSFLNTLEDTHNIKISMSTMESSLVNAAEDIIQSISPDKIIFQTFDRGKRVVWFLFVDGEKIALKEKTKEDGTLFYRCAALTAAWQLARLGAYPLEHPSTVRYDDKPIVADEVLSIIDSKYKENEMKSLKIISHSKHSGMLPRIQHEFI